MASAYFRQFAIDNNLTVDYGYMYGKYRNFYISLKETLGSTRILYIITKLGADKENLKKVLSVFTENELPKYCITDLKRTDDYLQFTFELSNDKVSYVADFLNKFIDSFEENGLVNETICPICHKPLLDGEDIAIVDMAGILTPSHNNCFEKGKEEAKAKAKKKSDELNKDTKGYKNGILGSIVYGLIYTGLLILSFFFMQFILDNADSGDNFVTIFQYLPVLVALSACPIIYAGYDKFKGKKGTHKHLIILWSCLIFTLVGTFFGFVASLLLLDTGSTFVELLELVGRLISCKDINGIQSFRWGFYLYIVIALGLACLSMVFKFSGKSEMDEANASTFEKLD